MPAITFDRVDVVFGPTPKVALEKLDRCESAETIREQTGNVVAVQGATLAVEPGEICVVMGLSGSGKSTLLRCVNGLNKVTRGRVLVRDGDRDVDVARAEIETLRQLRRHRISTVFQQFALMPWRTVLSNVTFGLEISGVPPKERRQRAEERLALVGLEKWKDKYPHELSGGMQQRVGLARALVTDADILLMDEPFSALDPLIRKFLQEELLELQRTLRKTILFVSHDFDEALKLGSTIAIMEGGKIVQAGRAEDIVLRPANEYIRKFVATMNPVQVLRCGSIMTPLAELERANDSGMVLLDGVGQFRIRLDAGDRPAGVLVNGAPGRLVGYRPGLEPAALADFEVVTGPLETPMRFAVEVCHLTGRPLVLLDGQGRLVGVVGEREILRGLLIHTAPPEPLEAGLARRETG